MKRTCLQCALCEEIEHDTCFCHSYHVYYTLTDQKQPKEFACADFIEKESEVEK